MATPVKKRTQYCKMGRPGWEYTDTLGDEICELIATSADGLQTILKNHPNLPEKNVIYKWVRNIPKFAEKYYHARELQQEVVINQMLEDARLRERDFYEDEKGVMRPNPVSVQRDKLICDNYKWAAARLAPRRFSEKRETTVNVNPHEMSLDNI